MRSALNILENSKPDFALLDLNLRDEITFDGADALVDPGVPFGFVTGFGSSTKVLEKFSRVKLLKKPLTEEAVKTIQPE